MAIGEWDDESTSKDRVCFGVEAKENKEEILFRVLSSNESPWGNTDLLGKILDRKEALAHELIDEAFAILELIIKCHPGIKHYLNFSN